MRAAIPVGRSLLAIGLVVANTFLCHSLLDVNATTAGFSYIICVLAIATVWGRVEAVVCSVAAMLALNYYFLPPVGDFTIADPQNWVALTTFLATGLMASHLSERAKTQARQAVKRQLETEQLYTLSRAIFLTDEERSIGLLAAQQIGQIFECRAVALYDGRSGEIFRGGPHDIPDIEPLLKQVATVGSQKEDPAQDLFIGAITLGGSPIGSLALQGTRLGDGARQALLNLVAITLERMRTARSRESRRRHAAKRKSSSRCCSMPLLTNSKRRSPPSKPPPPPSSRRPKRCPPACTNSPPSSTKRLTG